MRHQTVSSLHHYFLLCYLLPFICGSCSMLQALFITRNVYVLCTNFMSVHVGLESKYWDWCGALEHIPNYKSKGIYFARPFNGKYPKCQARNKT